MRSRSAYLKSGALSEDAIQRQCAEFVRVALPPGCGVLCFHIPNGGKRPRGEAGKLKAMGVRPGVLDWLVEWRGARGWIELKSEDGALSDDQKAFIADVTTLGDLTGLARSVAEFEGILRAWLPRGTLRATLMPGGGVRTLEHGRELLGHGAAFDVVAGPTPARDVAPGQPWPFHEHRTLAEVGVRDFAGGATRS